MWVFGKSQTLLAICENSTGRILDIVCRDPSVSKSHKLHVDILGFVLFIACIFFLDLSKVDVLVFSKVLTFNLLCFHT